MSVQATSWVWEHSKAEGTHLLILLAVADAANKEGRRSCQSVSTIAAMARVSDRTVQRALKALQGTGELVANGTDPQYRTTVYDLPGVMGDRRAGEGDTGGAEGDTGVTVGVTPMAPKGDTGVAVGVTPMAPKGDTAMSHYPSNPITTTPENPDAAQAAGALFAIEGGKGKPDDSARLILDWWWRRQNPRPAGKGAWHSGLKSIQALLNAGHTPKAVQDAVATLTPPLSIARLEIALNRGQGGTIRDTHHDHWTNGGGFTAEEGPRP